MAGMPRWLIIAICAVVALVVFWICIHPGVSLAPTVFRFAAFAAAVLLLVRTPVRVSGWKPAGSLIFGFESGLCLACAPFRIMPALAPLRC